MTFAAPLGLLGLLAVPAIVALHLFRDRLTERRVTALFLYPVEPVYSEGGRTRQRVLRSPSLWLEVTAAVLLSLWLAGWTFGDLRPRHVVVVLDASASMGARDTLAATRAAVSALCDELSVDDEVTALRSGAEPEVVVGPRARPAALRAWHASFVPTLPGHGLQPALDLARELAGRGSDVVVFTDDELADPGTDLRVVACGAPAGNAALASVRRVAGDQLDRLHVTVAAYGAVAGGELRVFGDGGELASVPLQLPPGAGEVDLRVPVPKHVERLRVELPPDALAVDDTAWLAPAPPRVVSVCDRLTPALREGLRIDRVLAVLEHWRPEPDRARAQVVLRPAGSVGRPAPGQVEVVLGPSGGRAIAHRGPFVVDRSHPLLAGVALDGVAWRSGSEDLPGAVLVAAGRKVLLSEEQVGAGRRVRVDVDPAEGNLVRAPDWPILFANVLDAARRSAPGLAARDLRVGDALVYRSEQARRRVRLLDPDGAVVAESEDGALDVDVARPGLYRVVDGGGQPLAEAAVRFVDPRESDLRRARRFDRNPSEAVAAAAHARVDPGPMRRLLAVLLLGVALCDWWWLSRRTT